MCGPRPRRIGPDSGSSQTTITTVAQQTIRIVYASSKKLISTNIFAQTKSETSWTNEPVSAWRGLETFAVVSVIPISLVGRSGLEPETR